MKVPAQNTMNRPINQIKKKRKIIQIALSESMAFDHSLALGSIDQEKTVLALCNDGSLWFLDKVNESDLKTARQWERLIDIPQDEDLENDD